MTTEHPDEPQSAACPDCNGTGIRDSGGVQPWGEAIFVPCDCAETNPPQPGEPQFQEMRARCKAAGIDLSRGKDFDGTPIFIASRWGLAKQLPTIQALSAWLEWTGQGRADA